MDECGKSPVSFEGKDGAQLNTREQLEVAWLSWPAAAFWLSCPSGWQVGGELCNVKTYIEILCKRWKIDMRPLRRKQWVAHVFSPCKTLYLRIRGLMNGNCQNKLTYRKSY